MFFIVLRCEMEKREAVEEQCGSKKSQTLRLPFRAAVSVSQSGSWEEQQAL